MEKKSHLVLIISIVTVILLAMLVGILVYFNLPAQRIRRMLKSANKYIAEENYDEAILTLQKMLEIDPKNEDLYVLLADTYEKNGDIDKEIEFLQEAVILMPENQKIADVLSDVNPEVTISEAEGTYNNPVRLTLDATENSKIFYIVSGTGVNDTNSDEGSVTGNKENEYSEPITLGKNGKYSIEYYAVSKTGYEGEHKTATYVIKLDESKYHFNEWVDEADGKHYYEADGSSVTGWHKIGGLWYFFDKSGVMLIGLQEYEENTYYLGTDGIMRTGWQEINGKKYYFNDSGAMLKNQWIDGTYYVGADGTMLTNAYTPDGYYVDADGKYISESGSGSMAGQTVQYTLIGYEVNGLPESVDESNVNKNIIIHYLSDTQLEVEIWNNGSNLTFEYRDMGYWYPVLASEGSLHFEGDKLYADVGRTDPDDRFIYAKVGSAASQQGIQEDIWNGEYSVANHTPIHRYLPGFPEGSGVDYLYADNNSVHIKGLFNKAYYNDDYQFIGYHEKILKFSDNCTFWGAGGEDGIWPFSSKSEFIQILNSHNGLGFLITVENDYIVKAVLAS